MTQEEKELVIKDLCGRLPYGVICYYDTSDKSETMLGRLSSNTLESFISNKPLIGEENQCKIYDYRVTSIKPYLRTMSSMTNVEREEYCLMLCGELSTKPIDWLIRKHFDFMGLIEKGLAIEAPEGMYLMEIVEKDMDKAKIKKINEVKSKILSNKAEAIAFMQRAGIYDEDGKLKKPYK